MDTKIRPEQGDRRRLEAVDRRRRSTTPADRKGHRFNLIAGRLGKALAMEHVLIGELSGDGSRLECLGGGLHGRFTKQLTSCELAESIFEETLGRSEFLHVSDVRAVCPPESFLNQLGADSYLGARLVSSDGSLLGLIAVLDSGPIANLDNAKRLLGVFAILVASEMEHVRTQQDRDAGDSRFRRLADLNLEGIIVYKDGIILDCNDVVCKETGYARDELLGQSVLYLTPPEIHAALAIKMVEKPSEPYETMVLRRDGSKILCEVNARTVQWGGSEARCVAIRNLTDHWRFEKELLKHRDDLQGRLDEQSVKLVEQTALIDQLADSVIVTDLQGRVTNWNTGSEQIWGFSKDEIAGRELSMIYPLRERGRFKEELLEPLLAKGVHKTVARTRSKAGRDIFALFSLVLTHDAERQPTGMIGYAIDITSQKMAEMNREESESKYRTLFDMSHDSIILIDGDVIVDCNQTTLGMFGYATKSQMVGKKPYDSEISPSRQPNGMDSKLAAHHHLSTVAEKGAVSFEWCHRTAQGELFDSIINLKRIGAGEKAMLQAVVRDITEEKRVQDELTESESKYRMLFEMSQDAIMTMTRKGYLDCNQAALDIYGFKDKDEFRAAKTGKLSPPVQPCGTNTIELANRHMDVAFREGETSFEWMSRRLNGELFPSEVFLKPIRIAGQEIIQTIVRDITKRKEQEMAVLAAKDEAEAANRAKSTFLANMSHEIRTPMNAILGFTHLLQNGELNAEQKDYLWKMETSGNHLLSIINDILDLSKIEAGKLVVEEEDFHLDAVFDQIQPMMRGQGHDKDLEIEIEKDVPQQWLKGDVTRVRQALLNYASNAFKFTDTGKILLRARQVAESDGKVLLRFEVQDTGVGIEPDKLAMLFEPFEQADVSSSRIHSGTGLGLTITRRLAQLMGGESGAESEPGRGSTFWFTAWFGRSRSRGSSALTDELENIKLRLESEFRGKRILLVEDNATNLEVAMAILSSVGMEVDAACNGVEGVEAVRNNHYDLVLMDVQMPTMDGLEATRKIRSDPCNNELPILAMTANVYEEDKRRCFEAGMDDFVAKPIDLKNMHSKLFKWLSRGKLRRVAVG